MENNKPVFVRNMFSKIAGRYDLMNRIMTFGQDRHWRKEMIQRAKLQPGARVLDIGTGTGDIARAVVKCCPDCQVIGGDFTITMMRTGKQKTAGHGFDWCGCDALFLPFPDESFDIVLSGFLFRNVGSIRKALLEQHRILRPGGRCITLDTTPAPSGAVQPVVLLYEQQVIPILGKWIAGNEAAYRYLPSSTANFLSAERFAAAFSRAGFVNVGFAPKMLGTVAIHWGEKPVAV